MKSYPEHLVQQARTLANTTSMSFGEIGKNLRAPESAIRSWCLKISHQSSALIANNEARRKLIQNSEKDVVTLENVHRSQAKLYCAILYGCEGAKYPASTCVSFVNSDPDLILSFVKLLRIAFELDESKWRIHLQIHSDQNFDELAKYWSCLLSIPIIHFYKPTITSPGGKKHRNIYFGTCSVRYGGYKTQLKLIGIFNEFLRKSAQLGGVA